MDIDLLSKMVKELVMDNDRVSLPGLGTFVVETVPAAFSDKGYTVNPPYRKLSFRPVRQEDSLLVDLYASANGVSKDIAEKALTTFIEGLREVLQSRKNVVFPGLGRLRATKENNFFFVADEDLDIYPEGFGLYPLSLKTHVETKEEVAPEAVVKPVGGPVDEPVGEPLDEPVDEMIPDVADVAVEETAGESEEEAAGLVEETAGEATEETVGENGFPKEVSEVTVEENTVTEDVAEKKSLSKIMMIALIVVLSLILLIVIYVVVARMFPDFIDSILYNAEEYDILHRS